ncbi:MAG: M15 family metallopeptidase [Candidatus Doudnabacteria bacterium]
MNLEDKINYYLIASALLLICIIAGSFFISQNGKHAKMVLGESIVVPTALDPNFSTQINECFIPVAAAYGYTLRITSGFRSLEDQLAIYNSGRTVDGHIISWAEPGKSLHNYGFAVDVVDRWNGYDIDFDKLAKIGTYCGLEQVDPPHFEHRAGLSTDQFADGMRPPPLSLPCPIMDILAQDNKPLTLSGLKACGAPDF